MESNATSQILGPLAFGSPDRASEALANTKAFASTKKPQAIAATGWDSVLIFSNLSLYIESAIQNLDQKFNDSNHLLKLKFSPDMFCIVSASGWLQAEQWTHSS